MPNRGVEGSDSVVPPGQRRPRNRLKPLIPLLIMAAFAVFIAREEVPAVADWWERTFEPEQWQSKRVCRDAALAELGGGRYPRLLDGGDLHDTPDGPYISKMKFAVLGEDGREQTVEYACYLDPGGRVFKLVRDNGA